MEESKIPSPGDQGGHVINVQPDGQGSPSPAATGAPRQATADANLQNLVALLSQFSVAIPIVFGAYRVIRDIVKSSGNQDPALTDDQLIQLMREPADRIVARANEFINSNRVNPPSI